jgi:hypothetical protein
MRPQVHSCAAFGHSSIPDGPVLAAVTLNALKVDGGGRGTSPSRQAEPDSHLPSNLRVVMAHLKTYKDTYVMEVVSR